MKFCVLGSGSRGNCVYVESGATAILIDAGFSGREIGGRLAMIDRDINAIKAIFVTHEHHDHISGVGVLSRRVKIPVHANERTFQGGGKALRKLFRCDEFQTGARIDFRDFSIRSFSVSHDSGDPVGFVISNGSKSLGLCTDTGTASRLITQRLLGCDGLILEFNHDLEMLKNGPYPPALKQRVKSNKGHLANDEAGQLLKAVVHEKLQRLVLAHISETNNLPEIAYREAAAILTNRVDISVLAVAEQHLPTPLFEIG